MYKILCEPKSGRGLYASEELYNDLILMDCELLVLSPEDTIKVEQTDLKYYTFKFNASQDCLVLGLGEIFNHSDKPNVAYELIDYDGRKVMRFYLIRNVTPNEQLCIDYNQDIECNIDAYIKSTSLVK